MTKINRTVPGHPLFFQAVEEAIAQWDAYLPLPIIPVDEEGNPTTEDVPDRPALLVNPRNRKEVFFLDLNEETNLYRFNGVDYYSEAGSSLWILNEWEMKFIG